MRYTTKSFIEKAREVHGDKFDYSNTEYNGYDKPTTFICRKHGEFKQTPHSHLFHEVCCPRCVNEINESQRKPKPKKMTPTEKFISKSKALWGDRYDYSKTEYTGSLNKVVIICPVHGEVEVYPSSHLGKGKFSGCPKCNKEKRYERKRPIKVPETKEQRKRRLRDDFITKAISLYGDKYDYSNVDYINNKTPVCIICPEHGPFWQRPNDHICHGNVCPMCGKNGKRNKKYTQEEYIEMATARYGGLYDYTKTVYKGMHKNIIITCPEHGDFVKTAMDHLNGCGCPEHHKKSMLELRVEKFLVDNNISFEYQKRFPWLGLQSLDYYLPDYNIAIECQGEQHFIPISKFGGEDGLKRVRERDALKKQLCEENGFKLFYYTEENMMKYLIESGDGERSFSKLEKISEKIFLKTLL